MEFKVGRTYIISCRREGTRHWWCVWPLPRVISHTAKWNSTAAFKLLERSWYLLKFRHQAVTISLVRYFHWVKSWGDFHPVTISHPNLPHKAVTTRIKRESFMCVDFQRKGGCKLNISIHFFLQLITDTIFCGLWAWDSQPIMWEAVYANLC